MADQGSNFNPLALAMLLVLAYLTWSLPRRFAVCPILTMICLMPLGQELDLFGLHFFFFRILLMIGALRIIIKGEARQMTWTQTDKIFIWWVVVSVVFGTMAKPSMDLLRSRLGDAYNALTGYFFVRCVVVDFEDVWISVRTLALLSLPVAALMVVENRTGHNLFSVFGGVPELTGIRDGHVRSQAAFRHPILAGTFGATLFPVFVGFWVCRINHRRLAVAASMAAIVIVVTASSSGSLIALIVALGGLALWKWRQHMRLIRWATVAAVLTLALVMKAPVWYLFDRLSGIFGGGGWHRSYLIDQTVKHFDEWWLFGTTYTAHWGPGGEVIAADPNNMDITNHYVAEGVKGGVLRLGLFLLLIVKCFKSVGRQLRVEESNPRAGFLVWALGVALFAHCVAFFSITYFDQTILMWYWLLAVITGVACMRIEPTSSIDAASAFEVRPG
jgi:hypothetical protein